MAGEDVGDMDTAPRGRHDLVGVDAHDGAVAELAEAAVDLALADAGRTHEQDGCLDGVALARADAFEVEEEVHGHAVDGFVLTLDKALDLTGQASGAADILAHDFLGEGADGADGDLEFFAQYLIILFRRFSGFDKPLGQLMLRPDDQIAARKFVERPEAVVGVGEEVDVGEGVFACRQFGYQLFGILEVDAVAEKQTGDRVSVGDAASAGIDFKTEDCRFHNHLYTSLNVLRSRLELSFHSLKK